MVVLALLLAVLAPAAPQSDPVPRPVLSPRWRPPATETTPDLDARAEALGLRRKGNGFARVRQPDDRFDALVRADGQVVFTLDPEVTVKVDGICVAAVCIGGKTEALTKKRRAARGAGLLAAMLVEAALTGTAQVGSWGYGAPRQGALPGTAIDRPALPVAHVVGRYGHLPAPVAAMSKFMDDTFEFRLELADAHARRTLARAHDDLVRTLDALWDSPRSAADKRAAVLEQWQALDAPPSDRDPLLSASLDATRSAAAEKARALVLRSVRAHAPEGSPDAFTPAELEAFNAASGVPPFCPYGRDTCP